MADYFGDNWQEEYYVWDCAAGTGNLLIGLNEPYRIWASTIDQADVDVIKDRIKNGNANLLESHIFQFDFLNDDFSKCPAEPKKILDDEERRKKLIVYINPPYAEHSNVKTISGSGKHKNKVSTSTKIYTECIHDIKSAARELYAQFLYRIYKYINGCYIANFSKLKTIQSSNFAEFRNFFSPKLEKLFIVPAKTFDNVKGEFPIGFFIWNTNITCDFLQFSAQKYDSNGTYIGDKTIYSYKNDRYVIKWLQKYHDKQQEPVAYLCMVGTDVQHNRYIFISNSLTENARKEKLFTGITHNNLIEACIYNTIRHVIPEDWTNDRDQYLYPKDTWESDNLFKTDCLTYTLFTNKIQVTEGNNNFIPFTEKEVCAKESFESHFMTDYIRGKFNPEKKQCRHTE
ncbi:MAG: hypothetical protein PUB01_03550 [Desulfovibrionaceae bacterium]|nr:hypothetical protein [Desulfovibrionaceae bacterium]